MRLPDIHDDGPVAVSRGESTHVHFTRHDHLPYTPVGIPVQEP